jgi:hypothetical protein
LLIAFAAAGVVGFAALTLLVFQLLPFAGAERSGPLPGDPWDGSGEQGVSQQVLEEFNEFSVFWLGPEFRGFHLQYISALPGEITIAYGTCEVSGGWFQDGGCPRPVSMHIRPACAITPSVVALGTPGTVEPLPGGALVWYVGNLWSHVMLWTGDVFITVHVTNELPGGPRETPYSGLGPLSTVSPAALEEAVAALRPLGVAARQGLSGTEAPDFSACPL